MNVNSPDFLCVPLLDRTPAQRERLYEMQQMERSHHCGTCGAPLVTATNEGWLVLRCGQDRQHRGYRAEQSATQRYRQGEPLPIHIIAAIERRRRSTLAMTEDNQSLVSTPGVGSLAMTKASEVAGFALSKWDLQPPQAMLFAFMAIRMGLDPLFNEIVPTVFTNRKTNKTVVVPIITETGWGSLAARSCPAAWNGPPNVTPVTDPDLKEQICGDREAFVWAATGRRRDWDPGREYTTYGWFTKADLKKAQENNTPAGSLPGNQARVRAINRWIRESYPEAATLIREARGALEGEELADARTIIEAEYHYVEPTKHLPPTPRTPVRPPQTYISPPKPATATAPASDPFNGFLSSTGELDRLAFSRYYRDKGLSDDQVVQQLGGRTLQQWCEEHPGQGLRDLVEDALKAHQQPA